VLKVKVHGKYGVILCAFEGESRYQSIYGRKCTPAIIHDQEAHGNTEGLYSKSPRIHAATVGECG